MPGLAKQASDPNPLHLIQAQFVSSAIIELCRPCAGMVRHGRGVFEGAAVLEISRDAGRSERVVAYLRPDAGRRGPPLHHRVGVRLG